MHLSKDFNHSYWELKQYFSQFDLIIVGSGIVGLSAAVSFKEKNKKARVLVLERGFMPNGASTKNAGFACFGSPSELLDDLQKMNEDAVWKTVEMRWQGLQLLRKRLGDKNIGFKNYGGYELFENKNLYENTLYNIPYLNKQIKSLLGLKTCYEETPETIKQFHKIKGAFVNRYEGQIDTGLMMNNLEQLAREKGILILNNINILKIKDGDSHVELESKSGVFKSQKVIVATNGFAKQLLNIKDVQPARAQVLITKPIKDLKIKGAFHFEQGYYYFRNIDKCILFGGGRNLDFKGETTDEFGLNKKIQSQLDKLLKEMILPYTAFETEYRWSGIMGVGKEKKPIIEFAGKNVLAAVRMGGMGIAIGSLVGEIAARKIS